MATTSQIRKSARPDILSLGDKISGLALFLFLLWPAISVGEGSCVCPQSQCAPCEVEIGVDFYTEKCGPSLMKVKSCKRPQCEPVGDQKSCLAKIKGENPTRAVASTVEDSLRGGVVILAVGQARLERKSQDVDRSVPIIKGMKVFAGDRIITREDGRVRIQLPELSEVFVSPQSELLIAEALMEKREGPSKRTILLDLQRGRVRSRVNGRYNDGESKFEVKTRAAVAGVRGTDFTVTFEMGDAEWKTEVRTTSGEVRLDARGESKQHLAVGAETYGAFIVPAVAKDSTSFEVEAALARGYMTPTSKLSKEDLLELDRATDVSWRDVSSAGDSSRSPTSNGEIVTASSNQASSLCRSPAGSFNQCSWTCEGNKKGASSCRSDLPGVQCVRRLCRASGKWAEPTVLPTKRGIECQASQPIVGDCGNYF